MGAAKEESRMLIEQLPDHATWDDIMFEFYVKKKLAKALEEAAERAPGTDHGQRTTDY